MNDFQTNTLMSMNAPANTTLDALFAWYQSLSPETLSQAADFYAPHAVFKDPFNEVVGPEAISQIFVHMFASVQQPRFVVDECVHNGITAYARWNFSFLLRHKPYEIHGVSRFELTPEGLIQLHRDYWDTAQELYEKLPIIGGLARQLRKRFSAH